MGSYVSCALSGGDSVGSASVVLPGGEVRRAEGPATAAEFMLDAPGHFLVSSRSVHVGRRFAPLAADEELEAGQVYVMFPMKRANAVVSAADMAVLLAAVRKEMGGGNTRVLPDAAAEKITSELGEESEAAPAVVELEEFQYRLSLSRSRRPNLETIHEEGIRSR
ncbi:uncharacterized protein LOC122043963 [Zingiber officinale]|uniref:DUF4228 domain protein n=1 Tax=Zingiber officinale TaxID=94328 RepID=A0A8J5I4S3_ZINOF|nr:uncharacterized protein LOC122043963 [Zingiber officinale]KAG6529087.1 hypothetical protein ZIOFF_011281 [Zingiber officinale]